MSGVSFPLTHSRTMQQTIIKGLQERVAELTAENERLSRECKDRKKIADGYFKTINEQQAQLAAAAATIEQLELKLFAIPSQADTEDRFKRLE